VAIYVTGISTSKVNSEFPPLRGTLTFGNLRRIGPKVPLTSGFGDQQ
jgi:hypothetical protein